MSRAGLRWLGAAWLLLFLLWLPFEDTTIRFPVGLALGLGAWLALRPRRLWSTLGGVLPAALFTAAWLGSLPALALALMLFKGGLHAHGFPDFTLGQAGQLLRAVPVCALLGGVLGAGAYFVKRMG